MVIRRSLLLTLAFLPLVLSFAPAFGQAASDSVAEFIDTQCRLRNGKAVASYRLDRIALGPEGRETLEGGSMVTFVHRLRIYHQRLFFDKLLAEKVIEVSASLDTLTHQYTLTRKVDGVPEASETTEEFRDVEKWLCDGRGIEIPLPPDEKSGKLELRVRTQYRRIFAVYLFPTELSAYSTPPAGCSE